jgi:hypothetical protein
MQEDEPKILITFDFSFLNLKKTYIFYRFNCSHRFTIVLEIFLSLKALKSEFRGGSNGKNNFSMFVVSQG